MASFTAGTSFSDGVANDVTAAKLGALVSNATPTSGFIQDRTTETVIATNDTLLIGDASDSNNLKRMTVANVMNAELTGTINTTAGTISTLNSTTGTIPTLTTGTTTSTAQIVTSGTIATLNSTTGVIAGLSSTTGTITSGTIPTLVATTLITTGTGTAAAPAIVPTGDTNTGIFFPAADTIAFSEGGAESMRIDSSGNVGVGTASPGALVDLAKSDNTGSVSTFPALRVTNTNSTLGNGTSTYNYARIDVKSGNGTVFADYVTLYDSVFSGAKLGTESSHPLAFQTGGAERLRIASAGQIGIGGANYGTSGQVLTSAGASTAPSWTTISTTPADGSITPAKLSQPFTSGTAVASTSGTAVNFTGIPSWVKRITVMFDGVSLSGTDSLLIQIGDSGGLENTGYNGGGARMSASAIVATTFTTGFGFNTSTAAVLHSGSVVINNVTGNTWSASGTLGGSASIFVNILGGSKSLSSQLDRVSVTRNGTDTFDAGSINIMYEG